MYGGSSARTAATFEANAFKVQTKRFIQKQPLFATNSPEVSCRRAQSQQADCCTTAADSVDDC